MQKYHITDRINEFSRRCKKITHVPLNSFLVGFFFYFFSQNKLALTVTKACKGLVKFYRSGRKKLKFCNRRLRWVAS